MLSPVRFLFLSLFSGTLSTALAETVLEVDFQNFNPEDRTITVANARPETSESLTASEHGAFVDPTAETGIASQNPKLRKGFGECSATPEGGGCFQTTGKAEGSYGRYMGGRGYGTGTIVMIFQPNFGGRLTGIGSQRACLFSNNYRGSSEEGVLFGINKEIIMVFGLGSGGSPEKRVTIPQPEWEPDKWYFLAASWSPLEKPTIYWRELATPAGEFAISQHPLANHSKETGRGVRLGNTGSNDASLQSDVPMKGKMAYFLWTDTYTDSAADYDALYRDILKTR